MCIHICIHVYTHMIHAYIDLQPIWLSTCMYTGMYVHIHAYMWVIPDIMFCRILMFVWLFRALVLLFLDPSQGWLSRSA